MAQEQTDESVREKIAAARALYAEHGPRLLADPATAGLLAVLAEAIETTESRFTEAGAAAACSNCGGDDGGCCFDGMQDAFEVHQLLINILLGVDLPDERIFEDACFFVGPRGCRLRAKYSFCLNFFCPNFQSAAGGEVVANLVRQVGRELAAGLELETALMKMAI